MIKITKNYLRSIWLLWNEIKFDRGGWIGNYVKIVSDVSLKWDEYGKNLSHKIAQL